MSVAPAVDAPASVGISTASWRKPLLIGAAVAATTAAISVLDPVGHHVPLCPFHSLTGLDCPACGGLRAVFSLSRGDIVAAASHHLLFTVAVPFLIVGWLVWMLQAVTRPGTAPLSLPRWTGAVGLAVLIVFTVARNVPTFAWLGST